MQVHDDRNSTPASPQPTQAVPNDKDGQKAKNRDISAKGILKLTERLDVRLFHTPEQEAYVSFYVKNHWETCCLNGNRFKRWLSAVCHRWENFVPNQNALKEAINTLEGHALFRGPEKQVHTRLAEHDGAIYLDLGNESWEVVRITSEGWDVVPYSPVKFVRSRDMLALPHPIDGGSLDLLRPVLNLSDDNLILAVAWLVGALQPKGPFPILVIEGTHGSAKSAAAKLLLSIVDPRKLQLRAPPRDARDLAIYAQNSWCLGFDNLSEVKPWFSDALCRLSAGGGLATRLLYTDGDEKIFEAARPVLLNGIAIGINREDLLDRCILLSLPPISSKDRLTEAKVSAVFREIQPRVLGCLLDAIACALGRLAEVKLPEPPRMADFATWVHAAEPALGWAEGSILDAYSRNRAELNELALEASPLYAPIVWIAERGHWEGTATDLSAELRRVVLNELPAEDTKPLSETPETVSNALRRLTPNLLHVDIRVEFARTSGDPGVSQAQNQHY
jgi:hemin uptake protein HemP